MTFVGLIAIVLIVIARALWIRRSTWRSRWEQATTLMLALWAVVGVLVLPWTECGLDRVFYDLTGKWAINELLAHICFVFAVAMLNYSIGCRIASDKDMPRLYHQWVELPVTLVVPLMFAAFWLSPKTSSPGGELVELKAGPWLGIYWVLLEGLLMYLLVIAILGLRILRDRRRQRVTANYYLVGCWLGLVGIVAQLNGVFIIRHPIFDDGLIPWAFAGASMITISIAIMRSWQVKVTPQPQECPDC